MIATGASYSIPKWYSTDAGQCLKSQAMDGVTAWVGDSISNYRGNVGLLMEIQGTTQTMLLKLLLVPTEAAGTQ